VEFKNAKYNQRNTIDCEINHPVYGWIPFTADPNDVEPLGAAVYQAAIDAGNVAAYVAPEPTAEQLQAEKKAQLLADLAALVYDFADGRTIQVRPTDEQNIRNAIEIMERDSIPSMAWRMADNVSHPVTVADLQGALIDGQSQAAALWATYNA